jgi:hypothetical protein
MLRSFFVALLAFALGLGELPARAAGVTPLGVVTQASRANLARANVSTGAAVYDGDSFTTASDGLLRVRVGSAQFYLPGQSALSLHSAPGGAIATLTSGRVVFSSAKAAAMDIEFSQAHIRPTSDQPTVAQISVVGPKTVDVRAQRGSLQFSYRGETQLVPEGAAYRFVLDPSDEGMTASAKVSAFPPKHQRKEPKGFVYFFIGATAVATYIAIDEALESPSKP